MPCPLPQMSFHALRVVPMSIWLLSPSGTRTSPSAPFSIAFLANVLLITSCSTMPPQPCTASFTSGRAPREVMTMGTRYFAHTDMSWSSRSLLLCTIWLIANGADGWPGCARSQAASVSTISASQPSSCSAGRAFRAGIDPTMPDVHCAMTSFGLLTMKSGAPMTGNARFRRTGGSGMWDASEGFDGKRHHAFSAVDDLVAKGGHAAEKVLGMEARGDHLGSQEIDVRIARREALLCGDQRPRHLPARCEVAGQHHVRHGPGVCRIRAFPLARDHEIDDLLERLA